MIETILNAPNIMLDIRNNSNDTALEVALITGRQMNFDILLKKVIQTRKINTLNKKGLCYLSLAILISEFGFIKHMIEDLGFDPNDNGDFEEENPNLHNYPLHQAVLVKRMDILNYLLSLSNINANIQDESKNGDSTLHLACKHSNYLVSTTLIDNKKIDINIKNKDGDNCLISMMRKFNKNSDGININKFEFLQLFFYIITRSNFDLNSKGKNGETILHVIRNNTEILMKLASKKLNIDSNIKDNFGKTAIDHILDDYSPNYFNVCTLLLFGNYIFNDKLIHSDTIFFILDKMPSLKSFEMFVNNGLDLNIVSKKGIFF